MPTSRKRIPWYIPAACGLALVLLIVLAVIALLPEPPVLYTYSLTDGGLSQIIQTEEHDPYAVLAEYAAPLRDGDNVEITTDETGTQLNVRRAVSVTVRHDGKTSTLECFDLTVGEALTQLGIAYDADDRLSPSANLSVSDGMEISLVRMEYQTSSTESVIPMEVIESVDTSLAAGEIVVDVEGSDGLQRTTATIVFEDGFIIEQSETVDILREPVTRVVRKGISHAVVEGSETLETQTFKPVSSSKPSCSSKPSSSSSGSSSSGSSYSNSSPVSSTTGGVLTTASGETYTYTKVLACSATAYTTEGFEEKHNASGKIARVGTVAVDPKVIPLGTALYIATDDGEYIYGYCVAEDTGGAVKGNIVDLFFDTLAECYAFGRRNCTVYVLG